MRIISDIYMTATERRTVIQMLEQGRDQHRTRLKAYKVTKQSKDSYQVIIASWFSAWVGEDPKWHRDVHTIKIK